MKKNPRVIARNGRRPRRQKQYVPGWGGMVGRGLGLVQKNFTSNGSIANKALRLARKVADAVNTEYKIFNTNSSGAVDYTGNVLSLIPITQGTADNQRIGDSLKIQNVTVRWAATRNVADALIRMMILWDPQNKISATSDVLEVVGSTYSTISPKTHDKRFQSRVLYDEVVPLTANTSTITRSVSVSVDQHSQYNAASTTVNTGDLKILLISNVVTTNLPTIIYYARISYTDN